MLRIINIYDSHFGHCGVALTKPVVAGKDILMAKMNAIKVAGELYAACITAGLVKELPTPATIKAYAEAIEAKLD